MSWFGQRPLTKGRYLGVLLGVFVSLCLLTLIPTQADAYVATGSNVRGLWHMNGNGNDVAGGIAENLQAATGGGSVTFPATGRFDQLVDLEPTAVQTFPNLGVAPGGVATELGIATPANSGVTLEAWIFPETIDASIDFVMTKGGSLGGGFDFNYGMLFGGSGDAGATGDLLFIYDSPAGTLNIPGTGLGSPGPIVSNELQHVAIAFNKTAGQIRYFVNGVLVASQAIPAANNLGTSVNNPFSTGAYFAGALTIGNIGDVRIDEMAVIANGTITGFSGILPIEYVIYDPQVGSHEIIALRNATSRTLTMDGYQLVSQSGDTYTVPAGGHTVDAGDFVVLHLNQAGTNDLSSTTDGVLDLYNTGTDGTLGDAADELGGTNNGTNGSGGCVYLYSPNGGIAATNVSEFVAWGNGGGCSDTNAANRGVWTTGTLVDISGLTNAGDFIQLATLSYNVSGQPSWTINTNVSATAVELSEFSGVAYQDAVHLFWDTESELNNLGFLVWRYDLTTKDLVQLNSSIIPGLGSSPTGASYAFVDLGVTSGATYQYYLEDIDFALQSHLHGPVTVQLNPSLSSAPPIDPLAYFSIGYADKDRDLYADTSNEQSTNKSETGGSLGVGGLEGGASTVGKFPGLYILEQNSFSIQLEIVTPSLRRNGADLRSTIAGYTPDPEPGAGELPIKTYLVKLPKGSSFNSLQIVEETSVPETFAKNHPTPELTSPLLRVVGTLHQGEDSWVLLRHAPIQILRVPGTSTANTYLSASLLLDPSGPVVSGSGTNSPGVPFSGEEEAFRLSVTEAGYVELDFTFLLDAGILDTLGSSSAPYHLHQGQTEIATWKNDGGDGHWDPGDTWGFLNPLDEKIFPREAPAETVFFIFASSNEGTSIQETSAAPEIGVSENPIPYFIDNAERNDQLIYLSSLDAATEIDHWFADYILAQPGTPAVRDYTVDVHVPNPLGPTSILEVTLAGVTKTSHSVRLSINGHFLGAFPFTNQNYHTIQVPVENGYLIDGTNTLHLELDDNGQYDAIYFDRLQISYPRQYAPNGEDQFAFEIGAAGNYTLGPIDDPTAEIWDVSDTTPVRLTDLEISGSGPYALRFYSPEDRSYLYFETGAGRIASSAAISAASDDPALPKNGADIVVIVPDDSFISSLTPWKMKRESQGYVVRVFDAASIGDRFDEGRRSVAAIRSFLTYAIAHWTERPPAFALLVGDASYDFKEYLGSQTGTLPSPLVYLASEHMETVSDIGYADLLGDDGIADIHVGRLPASTPEELRIMLEKTLLHEATLGTDLTSSAKKFLMVYDDQGPQDADFGLYTDQLQGLLPAGFSVAKAGLDTLSPVDLRAFILSNINAGQEVVNFIGHGSVTTWTAENIFDENAVLSDLEDTDSFALFIMMNCLSGYYHFPASLNLPSLSETLLRREHAGGYAAWASTGIAVPAPQKVMNEALLEAGLSGITQLGPATDYARSRLVGQGMYSHDVSQSWMLFGDPTTHFLYQNSSSASEGFGNSTPHHGNTPGLNAPSASGGCQQRASAHPTDLLLFAILLTLSALFARRRGHH